MKYQFDPRIINLAKGPLDSEKNLCFPNRDCDLMNSTQNNIVRCVENKKTNVPFKWHNKNAIELLNYMKKKYNQEPIYFNKKIGGYALWKNINIKTKANNHYLFNDVIIKDIPFNKRYDNHYMNIISVKKIIQLTHFQKYIVDNINKNVGYINGILTITSHNLYQCILIYYNIINSNINSKNIHLKKHITNYINKYKKYPRIQNKWCENFLVTMGHIYNEEIDDNILHYKKSNKPDELPLPQETKYYNGINFLPWGPGRECI